MGGPQSTADALNNVPNISGHFGRSEGLARTRLFHPWGHEPEGGVVRLRRSVSHVVGHGHLLTSGWVPLGSVRARRGPVWVRILVVHRYGSIESSVRARRVPSGHIGHIGHRSVRSKNIKFGPKRVENRRFGPKQRPNEPNRLSGPIRTTPEAKNDHKSDFLRKTAPGGRPAAPSDPVS